MKLQEKKKIEYSIFKTTDSREKKKSHSNVDILRRFVVKST